MIDWNRQWEQHAPNFKEGFLPLQIGDTLLQLKPGPGFGDLSHPTTRLMLEMMPEHVPGRVVFDVGCGSGILTIAAAAMGAESVQAVDIDPDAVLHTNENISHNGFDKVAHAALAFTPRKNPLALMNMIWSEQKVAWPQAFEFLTSGILAEQKSDYVSWIEEMGFTFLSILEQDGWCGFHFKGVSG